MEKFDDKSTVISILPFPLIEKKPGLIPGDYRIDGVKEPMKECQTLIVSRAVFPIYIDENRPALIVPEPSDRICAAICRDFKTSIAEYEPNVAEPGLFWAPGSYDPKRASNELVMELSDARRLQLVWFKRLVEKADDAWEKYKTRKLIAGIERLACRILNLDREWNIDIEVEASSDLQIATCKFCYSSVHPQAIICGHCQGILDQARYTKEFKRAETVR